MWYQQRAGLRFVQIFIVLIVTVLLSVFTFLQGAPAWANPVKTPNVRIQLISEVSNVQPQTPFWVGFNFKIRPGWHTYWRNPGDSGAAFKVNWKLPNGFTVSDIVYPYPEKFPVGPLMNYGYKNEVTLLSQITPAKIATNSPVEIQASAEWLVCEKECIPEEASLSLKLPVTTGAANTNTTWAKTFEATRRNIPKPSPWKAQASINGETLTLQLQAPQLKNNQIQEVSFFPDEDGWINNAAPQKVSFNDGLILQLQRGNRSDVNKVSGVLVVREKLDIPVNQAFNIQAPVGTQPLQTQASTSIPQVLLLAFLGGIVLNLMPCVFPVLSIKALGIARKSQASTQEVRLQALFFMAGVLVSFGAVAGTLLVLRSLGEQIGWGFQLQSPVFVTLMAYLMFAVGLSLSGVFIFGAALMGVGQSLVSRSGYLGEFFTGVFATLIATPCTAPFMATAIGIALTQPPLIAIAIFEVLGFGLALPYVVICFTPGLQRILPKPGAWMETLSQVLAFPMYAATAWLVWILTLQAGTNGLAAALAGLVLIAFAAWFHQKTRLAKVFWQRLGTVGALVVVGFALTLAQIPNNTTNAVVNNQQQNSLINWQPYSLVRLTELRQAKKPVFVNFSAAWCVSCLVNEQVALNQPDTVAAFKSKGVTLLKADWTNRNPEITKALESFGRSGVPLYVLYSATNDQPIILPQSLSVSEVVNTLQRI
ncbi:thiol-disulfide interchange protein DsbD homolog [Calothrix sp. NIES-4071]|nr:thiol-disulfide interchange protein DsbD homolog [Calothrix sp. NIES-4071]BAZ59148.1 thiol-disulfide interchange protein DsbD homolog [Calothrix sp. NIES-4105]